MSDLTKSDGILLILNRSAESQTITQTLNSILGKPVMTASPDADTMLPSPLERDDLRFRARLRLLFNLREDADEIGTRTDIRRGIEFKGANLWALIFAILIASIGLNTNSAAVIIGAMLISPLMGPIMGLGLALGTNDIELFRRAFRNLVVAVSISVVTSAVYFLLTPLDQAQSELLARTRPTLFDVLIAMCGGLIGIIASSRREKTNAIPGVAIATALMPPLCTAGYGLATQNWSYFFGAFYLFFINSVFICLATVIIVRLLHFQKASYISPQQESRVKFWMAFFAIATMLPSIYTAWNVVQESLFNSRAQRFLSENFHFKQTQLIQREIQYSPEGGSLRLILIGEPLKPDQQKALIAKLPDYQLGGAQLQIQQPHQADANLQAEFEALNKSLKVDIVEELYKKNVEQLALKDAELSQQADRIQTLEKALADKDTERFPVAQISEELKVIFPELQSLALAEISRYRQGINQLVPIALVQWTKRPAQVELSRLQNLLRARLKAPKLEIVSY